MLTSIDPGDELTAFPSTSSSLDRSTTVAGDDSAADAVLASIMWMRMGASLRPNIVIDILQAQRVVVEASSWG